MAPQEQEGARGHSRATAGDGDARAAPSFLRRGPPTSFVGRPVGIGTRPGARPPAGLDAVLASGGL